MSSSWRDFWKALDRAIEPELRRQIEARGWRLRADDNGRRMWIATRVEGGAELRSFDPVNLVEAVDSWEASISEAL